MGCLVNICKGGICRCFQHTIAEDSRKGSHRDGAKVFPVFSLCEHVTFEPVLEQCYGHEHFNEILPTCGLREAEDRLWERLHHREDQMPAVVKAAHFAEPVYCEKGKKDHPAINA